MTEHMIFSMGRGVSSPAQGRPEPSLHEGADAKRFWTSVHENLAPRSEDMLEAEPKIESDPMIPFSENRDAGVEFTLIAAHSEPAVERVTLALAGSRQELEHPTMTHASLNSSFRMKPGEGEWLIGGADSFGSARHDLITFTDTGSDASLNVNRQENPVENGKSKEERNSNFFHPEFSNNLTYQRLMIDALKVHKDNQAELSINLVSEGKENRVPINSLKPKKFHRSTKIEGINKQSDNNSTGVMENSSNELRASVRSLRETVLNSLSENRAIQFNKVQDVSSIIAGVDLKMEPERLGLKEMMPMPGNANVNPSVSHSQASYNFPSKIPTHALVYGSENLSNDKSFDFNVRSTNTDLDISFNATNKDVFDALSRHQSDLRHFLKGYGVDEFSLKFDLSDGQESSEFHERGRNQDDQTMIFVDLEENGKIENFLISGLDCRI
ncbi:hypothetical protein [uncultured Marivita sp.]|uniref:hypothetical protein n=1 Tax=uncultured Marivita sp. TaxID=888080 RepID=UPI00261C4F7F|nr:hypothetical protein [uncultured Marivita sp.]